MRICSDSIDTITEYVQHDTLQPKKPCLMNPRWSVLLQLFPYHLSDYVCRVLRVTPFKYYCDLLYTVMREEKSYDQIPNFAVSILVTSDTVDCQV